MACRARRLQGYCSSAPYAARSLMRQGLDIQGTWPGRLTGINAILNLSPLIPQKGPPSCAGPPFGLCSGRTHGRHCDKKCRARADVTPIAACRAGWGGKRPDCSRGIAHLILEVTDNGTPALTSYRRVIINIHQSPGTGGPTLGRPGQPLSAIADCLLPTFQLNEPQAIGGFLPSGFAVDGESGSLLCA